MELRVERHIYNLNSTCLGAGYEFFTRILEDLISKMKHRIGREFRKGEHHNLTFLMNIPFYHKFCTVCQTTHHDSDMYMGIRISIGPSLSIGDSSARPDGIVRLVYEEEDPELKKLYEKYCVEDVKATHKLFIGLDRGHGFQRVPHIDHVKFNGPATIVFWKDGTKTVVKHDGKGRKDKRLAILYAFMRKIYGEGKPYHNILNEIEEAVK